MKVLLIQPQSDYFAGSHGGKYPPFGLWLISSVLKKNGISVQILDLNMQQLSLLEITGRAKDCDLIGVNCNLDNFKTTVEIVKAVRKANPNAKIIGGGPGVSVIPEFYLDNLPFDQIVVGEGEEIILQIIANECRNKIVRSQKPVDLFCPDYSLIQIEDYWQEPVYGLEYPSASVFASRGCPFSCNFCSFFYLGNYRAKEIEAIEEEVMIVKEKGVKSLVFLDATFGIRFEHTMEVCSMLNKYQLEWSCMTRVDVIGGQKLEAMSKAGCKRMYLGLESFNQTILESGGKKTTVEKNLEAVQKVKSFGITPCAYLLFGLPGDTN
ncbi:MAG: radical SAM protein [Candidatus Pacebacteria bacterium]|nr:radical SAM protein [Candidatus Paceibacterota bacterium]